MILTDETSSLAIYRCYWDTCLRESLLSGILYIYSYVQQGSLRESLRQLIYMMINWVAMKFTTREVQLQYYTKPVQTDEYIYYSQNCFLLYWTPDNIISKHEGRSTRPNLIWNLYRPLNSKSGQNSMMSKTITYLPQYIDVWSDYHW